MASIETKLIGSCAIMDLYRMATVVVTCLEKKKATSSTLTLLPWSNYENIFYWTPSTAKWLRLGLNPLDLARLLWIWHTIYGLSNSHDILNSTLMPNSMWLASFLFISTTPFLRTTHAVMLRTKTPSRVSPAISNSRYLRIHPGMHL